MSELITDIDVSGPGIKIIHAQDVEPTKQSCYARRTGSNQHGRQGLGIMTCSIPAIEIEKAKHMGINLMKKDQRDKWLRNHPEYRTYKQTGRDGRIIIK